MKRRNQGHGHKERGIALITVLLALLLLTAIAVQFFLNGFTDLGLIQKLSS